MQKTCSNGWCKAPFEILEEDLSALDRLSPIIAGKKYPLPPPTRCVRCRHQERAMTTEGITFFRRTSDLTGKSIISLFNPERPYPVYAVDEWWSDSWDDLGSGRVFDPKQSFFAQLGALDAVTPKMATLNENCENCEFCASAGGAKNCYYCIRAYRSEDMYYSEAVTGYNKNLCDSLQCQRSELLYECVQCLRCHASSYLYRCSDVADSHFCSSLRSCHHCLFCHNLSNQHHHVFNKPVSEGEYVKILAAAVNGSHQTLLRNLKNWHGLMDATFWKDQNNLNCENCRGDALVGSSGCHECYNSFNLVDCRYCWDLSPSEQCASSMDLTRGGIGELLYYSAGLGGGNYHILFSRKCRKSSELLYCLDCYSCKDCFGCSGLKNKQYCILNKQYTKVEYEKLAAIIMEHMQANGEYGMFFPQDMSAFAYNHSLAMLYFPLAKAEVQKRNWWWSDYDIHVEAEHSIPAERLPDSVSEIPDDLLEWAIVCEKSHRPFKLIRPELALYRDLKLPIPHEHPDVRMERRRKMLNPYQLFPRNCANCMKAIETSYPPESKAIVYCEECYLKAVY